MSTEITSSGRRKVRWIIAHFPLELFVRAAKAFAVELEKLCPGQFEIEIHTVGSYKKNYGYLFNEQEMESLGLKSPSIPGLEETSRTSTGPNANHNSVDTFVGIKPFWSTLFQAMKEQKFEMSQTQVNIVGSHLDTNFHAIDLPYLFKDHDHVSRALDNGIGDRLSEQVAERTGLRALGYTYSGGYRIVGSTDGVTSLSDLESKKFITFTAPSTKLFEFAGVNHISRFRATADDVADMSEEGGAIETTYLRFGGKNVLKTNHSMFMTSILTSDAFLATLTEEQREAFKESARRVAKIERVWSVEDAAKYERQAQERGVTIVPISEEDEQRLRQAAEKVYDAALLEKIGIDASLVEEIISIGKAQ